MLTGRSIEHVHQGIGKIYSLSEVKGYYNDLTEKVTKDQYYSDVKLPILITESGSEVLFPIAIFQFGLGAYDLYLLENETLFLEKFKICVDWAVDNQNPDGSWNNFYFNQPEAPYSSMAQGEGVSLLVRAYKEFNNEKYLLAAKRAISFLIKPLEEGGTTKYTNNEIFLQEFTNKPTVLNGWIFSLFGLYDYIKIVNDDKNIIDIYNRSIQTLANHMNDFDNGYWSKYNIEHIITSPFYHRLHIAQLNVMYEITGEDIFSEYLEKWTIYNNTPLNRFRAFTVKAMQKLLENEKE
ncbi:D-glucuronyl C5-epimerase family protein [Solibacillus sp. FSL H8-0538]|uniref:D-glucuronyl C5-epimerase family protein n=1 Tax=Solibacillus sp. FSL H8-0538 TaxID=2921400 RepID=UPI0030FB4612